MLWYTRKWWRGGLAISESRSFYDDLEQNKIFEPYIEPIRNNLIDWVRNKKDALRTSAPVDFERDPKLQREGADNVSIVPRKWHTLDALEKRISLVNFDVKTIKNDHYGKALITIEIFDLDFWNRFLREGWYYKAKHEIMLCYRNKKDIELIGGYCVFIQDSNLRDWFENEIGAQVELLQQIKALSKWYKCDPCETSWLGKYMIVKTKNEDGRYFTYCILIPENDFPTNTVVKIPESVFLKTFGHPVQISLNDIKSGKVKLFDFQKKKIT